MRKELHNLYYVTKPERFLSAATIGRSYQIKWSSGEVILPRNGIFYINSGMVRIAGILEDGQRKTLMLAGKGHFLHEVAFFHKKAGDTEIIALGTVSCNFFPADLVQCLLAEDADFREAILFSMASKLSTHMVDLLMSEVSGEVRLFYLLKAIAEHSNIPFAIPLDLSITQSEIADCLGFHRVSVNRLLKALEKRGLIRCMRKKIILLSMDFWKTTLD